MPRIATRGRALSFAAALLLLAGVLVPRLDPGAGDGAEGDAALAATSSCADVLLMLAPGNAEGTGSTPVNAGATLGRFRDSYLRDARGHGRSVEVRTLNYRTAGLGTLRPADPTRPANQSITATHVKRWQVNLTWAADQAHGYLVQKAASCPEQAIVLGGYAQGAGVMHRVLRKLGTGLISRRVVGAALVSDPHRNRSTAALRWGDPAADATALGILHGTRVAASADVPVATSYPRVLSVCRRYDVVCDYRGQRASLGLSLAASYLRYNAAVLDAAGLDLATRTRAFPDPRPEVTTVNATVGVSLRHQLTAEVLPRFADSLRWTALDPLPTGMKLDAYGVLTGRPTASGTWRIDYTVRNIGRPAFNRPISGQLVLKATAPVSGGSTKPRTSAGGDASCTIRGDGSLWCWGDNYEGQVGNGSRDNQTRPVRLGTGTGWATVNTGGTHTCAVKTSGALWCWGRNDYGQLGDGSRTRRLSPVRVGTGLYTSVATNTHHTCAIARDTALLCWGLNDRGQLGTGDRTTRIKPVRVGTGLGWASVSTGAWHTCATRTNGSALCWGANMFGQLGRGDTTQRIVPLRISGPGDGWGYRRISAGDTHTCAVTTGGGVRCWGANTSGQVGDGTRTLRTLPTAVADSTRYLEVDAGLLSSCGVTTSNRVRCWGAGWTGTLGAGGLNTTNFPKPASTSVSFSHVEVGWGHACGRSTGGAAYCWGLSSAGQVGLGSHATVRVASRVIS